jgi:hypothetical protein
MRASFVAVLSIVAMLVASVSQAHAWDTSGTVLCDVNRNAGFDASDLPLGGVRVLVQSASFSGSAVTDGSGQFFISLPEVPDTYTATLDSTTLPVGSNVIIPGSQFQFVTQPTGDNEFNQNWLVDSPQCRLQACWLTGGGTKFEPITGTNLAQRGPQVTFGGNVHPGCSATAGAGGNWNHVDHSQKLHFQGTAIPTVQCGNVPGIPAGSSSPQTPVNFIEFSGTGTLRGVAGNKTDFGTVNFFARAEDRNEPGSNGAKDGALIDRYFLRVFDSAGNTLLLFDGDGDPATVDPVTITGGNLQIHISSCDNPPLGF